MNTFKLTCVAAFMCSVVSGNTFAASKDDPLSEKEEKIKQAALNIDGVNTVATPELIMRSDKEGQIRDRLRTDNDIDGMRIQNTENKTILEKKKRALLIAQFVNDNVPAHIIAMGDNAINAYITEHYSGDDSAPMPDKAVVVWESSNSVLSAPTTAPQAWTPEVTTVSDGDQEGLITVDLSDEQGDEESDEFVVTDEDQKKALEIFDMGQEDLDALFDGKITTGNADEPEEVVEETNVVISDIEIKQLVIIGLTKYVDAKLTFEVLRNGQSRKVVINKDGLKPGAMFKVEKDRFELVSIDENQVVFENLDRRKTFTSPIS